jgi:periplasmic copper chaperone A
VVSSACTKTGSRWRRRVQVTAASTGGFLAAGLLFAAAASAHVKVSGVDAVQGGSGVITFRVPSESDTASTTDLRITFPASYPFTEVATQPKAGWKATVITKPLKHPLKDDDGDTISSYVAQVDFKAQTRAAAIPPGEFDLFNLSVGTFPKVPSMSFAALQTYSNGQQVNWDEQSANGAEPEHPAPVLQLAAAGTANSNQPTTTSTPQAANATSGNSSGRTPAWPGIVGLIAGVLALLVSIAVLVSNRTRAKATPSA